MKIPIFLLFLYIIHDLILIYFDAKKFNLLKFWFFCFIHKNFFFIWPLKMCKIYNAALIQKSLEIAVIDWFILTACQPIKGYFMPRG